jgi:hypothetical protein
MISFTATVQVLSIFAHFQNPMHWNGWEIAVVIFKNNLANLLIEMEKVSVGSNRNE